MADSIILSCGELVFGIEEMTLHDLVLNPSSINLSTKLLLSENIVVGTTVAAKYPVKLFESHCLQNSFKILRTFFHI